MHQPIAVGDDADAARGKRVLVADDVEFVSGDRARRHHDRVAGRECHARVIVGRDAGERRARLALAARQERDDLVARQMGKHVLVIERRQPIQHVELGRHVDDAAERAADNHDIAPRGLGGQRDRADARDVGGESGEGDAPLRVLDDVGQFARDFAFAGAFAFPHRVGGIADQRQHALVADRLQAFRVRRRADGGVVVELPVAGMEDRAEGSADRQRVGFRDRMRDVDVLDLERTGGDALARVRTTVTGTFDAPGSAAILAASRLAVNAVA